MMIISIIDTTYIYIHSFLEYSFTYLMQYLYIYIYNADIKLWMFN